MSHSIKSEPLQTEPPRTGPAAAAAGPAELADAVLKRAAELDAIITAIGDGVVVCDPSGRVTLCNPAAAAILDGVWVDRQVMSPSTFDEILAALGDAEPGSAPASEPALGSRGGPLVRSLRGDPDRWVELATYPVDRRGGGTEDGPATIIVLRDVAAARRRDAIRETFVGVLSHELRTPVTTIFGGAKLLARPGSDMDEATRREIFEDIVAESDRLQRLVEDVVAMTRFGEGDGDLGQEPVLLQHIVPDVVATEQARWPGLWFELDLPLGLPTVVADPVYVEQVIRNLLSNAAKYGGTAGTVRTVVEPGVGEVCVRVLDGGPGIPPDEADRVFDRFFRSPSMESLGPGAGIGLFVCARLVQAMGGRIWTAPRSEGGTEFGFALRMMADGEPIEGRSVEREESRREDRHEGDAVLQDGHRVIRGHGLVDGQGSPRGPLVGQHR